MNAATAPESVTALWPVLRTYWHPVARVSDVGDGPLAVRLLGEALVVWRAGDRIVCFRDLCIHRGTPLSLGDVDGETLRCAYHGWEYDPSGRCVRIPALPGDRSIPTKAGVDTFRADERYGLVWVCLEEPRASIPGFPEYADPAWWNYLADPATLTWKASAARAIENFVDLAHFPWIHEGILGDRRYPETPSFPIRRHGEELRYHWDAIPDTKHPTMTKHPAPTRRVYRLTRPFSIHLRLQQLDSERAEVFFQTECPVSAKECIGFQFTARNYDLPEAERRRLAEVEGVINAQDRRVVEAQRPEELPLDLSAELHIKGPDAVAVEYRRFMAELGVDVDS